MSKGKFKNDLELILELLARETKRRVVEATLLDIGMEILIVSLPKLLFINEISECADRSFQFIL